MKKLMHFIQKSISRDYSGPDVTPGTSVAIVRDCGAICHMFLHLHLLKGPSLKNTKWSQLVKAG
jgi:hypothetical protein